MSKRIEDYALIGDTQTAALIATDGSIDWLCFPRFDSGACFSALLGDACHGWFRLAPRKESILSTRRCYRAGTLILETTFVAEGGSARVVDCMPPRQRTPDLVRVVEGGEGEVWMEMELLPRFDYGSVAPWLRRLPDRRVLAIGGPDALVFAATIPVRVENAAIRARFCVRPGERIGFVLSWHPSSEPPPAAIDGFAAVVESERWWRAWTDRCRYVGPYRDAVLSSLSVLKALTFAPTGGMVAAATTSLPEWPGGTRNWDYRFCWLRDATFILYALLLGGYEREAAAFRDWLLRAAAGDPSKLQIMYGIAGERRLPELTLPWLPGHGGSSPVRTGNAAAHQRQLDVFGEILDVLHKARRAGLDPDEDAWRLQAELLEFLEGNWYAKDHGLWEVRGPRQYLERRRGSKG